MRILLLGSLMMGLTNLAMGHEGHAVPGALPPAPHGGKVAEAKLKDGGYGKSELFFEVVYGKKQLQVYPLTLEENSSVFSPVAAKDISGLELEAEIPRKKTKTTLKAAPNKNAFKSVFDPGRAHRFLVKVAATYKGEKKHATVQVEKR